ncbi:GGT7 isoform 2, partial [Pan troglodytes]
PLLPVYELDGAPTAAQVLIMGPDDFIVAMVSSLNQPFGSGLITPSGILLNSQMLDFSWPNRTANHSAPSLENSVQPGKRPLSFLLPTVVRPAEGLCGTYLALGANGAARGLSGLTQHLNRQPALFRVGFERKGLLFSRTPQNGSMNVLRT